jgi:CheY-like chemotaxis protein
VIITDIGLRGGCDGVSFAGRLHARERTADIPVVAVTGRPLGDLEGAGFLEVLQKPILPDVLIASVRNALEVSRELRARGLPARERVTGLLDKSDRLLKKPRGVETG